MSLDELTEAKPDRGLTMTLRSAVWHTDFPSLTLVSALLPCLWLQGRFWEKRLCRAPSLDCCSRPLAVQSSVWVLAETLELMRISMHAGRGHKESGDVSILPRQLWHGNVFRLQFVQTSQFMGEKGVQISSQSGGKSSIQLHMAGTQGHVFDDFGSLST